MRNSPSAAAASFSDAIAAVRIDQLATCQPPQPVVRERTLEHGAITKISCSFARIATCASMVSPAPTGRIEEGQVPQWDGRSRIMSSTETKADSASAREVLAELQRTCMRPCRIFYSA
jgi:hypothetical protein